MIDIINKLIAVIIAFMLLILAPLVIHNLSMELTMKRSIMNEMVNVIDKVTDTGRITNEQLEDFYIVCSTYGITTDVIIERYAKEVNPTETGDTYTKYVKKVDNKNYEQGDIIKVSVKAISYTGPQKMAHYILHISQPKFECTLSGMVRN